MSDGLFRTEALDQFQSTDQHDKLLQVTRPRDWLWMTGILLLTACLVAWMFLGELPREASGEGVIDRTRGVPNVITPSGGLIQSVLLKPGDRVAVNQVAANLYGADGVVHPVLAPVASQVSAVWVRPGMFVPAGTVLMNLGQPNQGFSGEIFVSPSDARAIKPGMMVRCAPFQVRKEVYGFAEGRVVEVSPILSTPAEIEFTVRDPDMAQRLIRQEMQHHVVIALNQTTETASGLEWSTGKGPPWKLADYGRCRVSIVLGQYRPIAMLFPSLQGQPDGW